MALATTDQCTTRDWRRKLASLCGIAAYALLHASSTQPAIADGDTRTLTFINKHTNETGAFTYLVNGAYDAATLDKLNWFMRDWRLNEQVKMDPHLFDIVWDVYRESGSSQAVDVLSAYRSPQTNAMLRRRSRQVAERSQHMQGKAIDAHFFDIRPGPIRDIAMRQQEGGVGFYPIGATPWVHIDSGTVRYWPRMSRSALARLFPDGKTVFIPADGQPMERYADAKAMIETRGGEVQTASSSNGLFGWLFGGTRGGGADDEEETGSGAAIASGRDGPPASLGRGSLISATLASAQPTDTPESSPSVVAAPSNPQPSQAPESSEMTSLSSSGGADVPDPPVPPRKPLELLTVLDAPFPPKRPVEFAPAVEPASAGRDLISAMLEHEALPGAISNGIRVKPKDALALVDSAGRNRDENFDFLARAATLAPPPLPPRRPKLVASDPKAVATKASQPNSPSNPYGSLTVNAFNSTLTSVESNSLSELHKALLK